MKYTANPVTVDARRIITATPNPDGSYALLLEDGHAVPATAEMCARMTPVHGDYLVTQEDGYTYLNPKDVFERKYSVVPVPRTPPTFTKATCRGCFAPGNACGYCEICEWERTGRRRDVLRSDAR
jgi:hypothetical protein